jgi:hypothetical protein
VEHVTFTTRLASAGRERVMVPVPLDPDVVWGAKPMHHVTGTVGGFGVRGTITTVDGRRCLILGAAWRRDRPVGPGDTVEVDLVPEGPQRSDLPADLTAALDADPAAAAFFDSLAQFYRKAYLNWIDATRRRPDVRAERIAVVVRLLAEGKKARPK